MKTLAIVFLAAALQACVAPTEQAGVTQVHMTGSAVGVELTGHAVVERCWRGGVILTGVGYERDITVHVAFPEGVDALPHGSMSHCVDCAFDLASLRAWPNDATAEEMFDPRRVSTRVLQRGEELEISVTARDRTETLEVGFAVNLVEMERQRLLGIVGPD